jgi:hypothetical protein
VSNGVVLSITSDNIQRPSSRVSPRKESPNNFLTTPVWTLEVGDTELMWPEHTFGTICSNQVASFHIFLNFLSVYRLYEMRDDVIIILIESLQLCITFDFASVVLDMLAEKALDSTLAETNRVGLLR